MSVRASPRAVARAGTDVAGPSADASSGGRGTHAQATDDAESSSAGGNATLARRRSARGIPSTFVVGAASPRPTLNHGPSAAAASLGPSSPVVNTSGTTPATITHPVPLPSSMAVPGPSALSISIPSPTTSSPLTLTPSTSAAPSPALTAGPPRETRGKGKATPRTSAGGGGERRVLPARIRRVGGAEGIRELEEMVVDWLERWGDVDTNPPDNLGLVLTTLPLSLVTPVPYLVDAPTNLKTSAQAQAELKMDLEVKLEPKLEGTPAPVPIAGPSSRPQPAAVPPTRIETPSWVMVRPGEDDQMEAREEMRAPGHSPSKRLRRGVIGAELVEDMSDNYYEQLHRKFEAFERRQRIREREKLQFERYKMRARIELLRNLPGPQWASVVQAILARADNGRWARGRRKLELEGGADWLRRWLIREGQEVLGRYDQLLPNESKKHQPVGQSQNQSQNQSRAPSPSASSLSPPPQREDTYHPKRTRMSLPNPEPTASREPASRRQSLRVLLPKRKRPRESTTVSTTSESTLSSPDPIPISPPPQPKATLKAAVVAPPKPLPKANAAAPRALPTSILKFDPKLGKLIRVPSNPTPGPQAAAPATPVAPVVPISQPAPAPSAPAALPPAAPTPSPKRPRYVAPSTPSGVPCLIEAAQKRESAILEALAAKAKVDAAAPRAPGSRRPRIAREKTRESSRLSSATPFGMPIPPPVENKTEFSLSDEEEFWPIIAAREAHATALRLAMQGAPGGVASSATNSRTAPMANGSASGSGSGSGTVAAVKGVKGAKGSAQAIPEDEAMDVEGVEEAVVL
ncbi:uncharacterized protein EHS24_008687 [Apiotrichum porosum]|uniref:Something about silencing protein 4 domain-containing protein n=1 Tax=Apiotrichum porosum TaxID=105984 RepID=A0A427XQZ5_9TREE|nr:uncharacterized protein EHS24_008687 [Apiotrichum porosum]RSH81250.1 hypothetical protein EHS24_008687 [Apiotrichum porosum]